MPDERRGYPHRFLWFGETPKPGWLPCLHCAARLADVQDETRGCRPPWGAQATPAVGAGDRAWLEGQLSELGEAIATGEPEDEVRAVARFEAALAARRALGPS